MPQEENIAVVRRFYEEVFNQGRDDRVLDREASEVGATLAQAFERDGIKLHLNAEVKQVAYMDGVFTRQHVVLGTSKKG